MNTLCRLALVATLLVTCLLGLPPNAEAFCGFYVGKADASLYNEASQVVIARNGDRTVISMMNDYEGNLDEFALVVPVPVVLKKGQVNIGDRKLFERLDAFSAPRLVEYHDPSPCRQVLYEENAAMQPRVMKSASADRSYRKRSHGVTVEAQYSVGEYDIVILSAKESDGLEVWLRENGYRIPEGASRALRPYIRQNLKFFVAKVNLSKQKKTGLNYLRPLQFAFESPKFMLPVRLGMLNAKGPQDLIVYALTANGRVETTNYRSIKLPTGMDLPVYLKGTFADFYRAMFTRQAERESLSAVFTEYFWNMGWCDPCAADPLSRDELRGLGVFWIDEVTPSESARTVSSGALPVMVTRMHVRYTPDSLPEDLVFQETNDRQNFQARYVLRHAWDGSPNECSAAPAYFEQVRRRQELEAKTLANLTGWKIAAIRGEMSLIGPEATPEPWWRRIW